MAPGRWSPRTDDDWPPALAVLAGVGAFIGAVPGILFVLSVPLTSGLSLGAVLADARFAYVCVVLPWLLVTGAVRLMSRRGRRLLVLAGSSVTAYAAWVLHDAVVHDRPATQLFLVAGPALAPLAALAPSVGRWLASAPEPSLR